MLLDAKKRISAKPKIETPHMFGFDKFQITETVGEAKYIYFI